MYLSGVSVVIFYSNGYILSMLIKSLLLSRVNRNVRFCSKYSALKLGLYSFAR